LSVAYTLQTFGQLELVGAEITSKALSTNSSWPLVHLPHFEQSVNILMNMSYSDLVDFSPIVTSDSRDSWEQFATDTSPVEIPTSLYNNEGSIPVDAEGPFAPVWQLTPKPTGGQIVNFDLHSLPSFSRGFTSLLGGGHTILSEPADLNLLHDFPGAKPSTPDVHEPHSFLIHPLYSNFGKTTEVVGTLTALLRLQYLFAGTLPLQVSGLVTVLRDTCGSNYTYVLNGPEVVYKGEEDLHDPAFDYLAVSVLFTEQLYGEDVSISCGYTLDIYPSAEFQDVYYTNDPWIYSSIVLAIFVLMGFLILYYNSTVNRRQDSLMNEAVHTNNILTSLFPSNVHERLFRRTGERADDRELADQVRERFNNAGAEGVSDYLARGGLSEVPHADEVINGMYTTKPIADLFPNTTIMFADIVGFNAWSSQREPTHVFRLLETIFRAFDNIAQRMGVFKVETVGDCYVAVAGLPQARNDPAVVMATFAKECMVKMIDLAQKMVLTLGPDTGDLSMRFGLHSGPVTAGVLRGEKSRFQLFGDSMNTAARMETTGERKNIHISHETAELLISAGHSKMVRQLCRAPRKYLALFVLTAPCFEQCRLCLGEIWWRPKERV
jgi:class 3 adenylate cyclase